MKRKHNKSVIDTTAYAKRADLSARHFVSMVAQAILEFPRIKAKRREDVNKRASALLDELYKSFIDAQMDGIKFAVADICKHMGFSEPIYPVSKGKKECPVK